MKYRMAVILILAVAGATGVTIHLIQPAPRSSAYPQPTPVHSAGTAALKPEPINHQINPPARPPSEQEIRHPSKPTPLSVRTVNIHQSKPPRRVVAEQDRTAARNRRRDIEFWKQHMARFEQLQNKFDREQDPARRSNLLQALATFVRIDTPATLDWAMSLQDPVDQRAALEAINKYALSGIGARIEQDGTGLPKIRQTTVLSAIGSTGRVQPGDHIVGIVDATGKTISFKGRPIRQVIQRLRGQPGTEVHLRMQRTSSDGGTPYTFDVNVQRSLIVVQPPF